MPKKFTDREIIFGKKMAMDKELHERELEDLVKRLKKERRKRHRIQRRLRELEFQLKDITCMLHNLEETKLSIRDLESSSDSAPYYGKVVE